MRKTLLAVALVVSVPLLARGHGNRTISTETDGPMTDCSQLRITLDGERVPVTTQEVNVSGLRSLEVDASANGGVSASGWDQGRYAVTACVAGSLAGTSAVRVDGNRISSAATDDDDAIVYFIVRAPRDGAALDLRTTNGPVSVREVGGTVTARTSNGPISIHDVAGTVEANASNGPISFSGSRGNVRLHATNGPISVKLAGSSWEGGSFDAVTSNGPLTLKLPRNYASGIVVESNGHGPVSCKAEACGAAVSASRRSYATDDDMPDGRPRRLEFGSGAATLHLATSNGPISVKDAE